MASNAIRIAILANAAQARNELESTANAAQKIEGRFSRLRAPAIAAIGGIALLGKASVDAASKSQQSIGATETVFGKYSKQVIKDSNKAATQFGLDANTYRENSNLLGALFSNQGVAVKKLGGATKEMIGVGADLSAVFGGTTTEAVEALSAAFKGEFDSLEKYGISLKESTIQAELAARGQDKLTGKALAAAKQQVTSDLIMKQSSKTRGAFAKESNTLAHQQQVLAAKFENVKAKLGTALLPVMTQFTEVLSKVADWAMKNTTLLTGVVAAIGALAAIVLVASAATKVYNAGLAIYKATTTAIKVATIAWRNAQLALNLVMIANPIALVIVAIVALVAIFVIAYKKSDTFRAKVDAAWSAIKKATGKVFDWVKEKIEKVFNFLKNLFLNFTGPGLIIKHWDTIKEKTLAAWNKVRDYISEKLGAARERVANIGGAIRERIVGAWDTVKEKTREAWQRVVELIGEKIGNFMEKVRGIKDRVTGAFANAGSWLYNSGKSIISGLIDGFAAMFGSVKDKLGGLTDKIKDWKGPLPKDKRLLKPAGAAIIGGLIDSMEDQFPDVRKSLTSLTKDISKFDASVQGDIDLNAHAAFTKWSASKDDSMRVNITLSAQQIDQLSRGRAIQADLDAYRRAGGRVSV